MKNIITLMILLSSLIIQAQEAALKLDFVQTKTGEKYYGKITEMDPKTGITIKTYGDGNLVKLKHDEIETIKIGSGVTNNDTEEKEGSHYSTGISLCYIAPYSYSNSSLDQINKFDFKRFGFHLEPTICFSNKNTLGFYTGLEVGSNYSSIPMALSLGLNRNISNNSSLGLKVSAGSQICISNYGDFTDANGRFYEKGTRSYAGWIIGVGANYTQKFKSIKLFFEAAYRFDSQEVYYYRYVGVVPYTLYLYDSLTNRFTSNSIQLSAGFYF